MINCQPTFMLINQFVHSLGVVATADAKEAFTNIDVVLMVGAMPRKEGMERKDLLEANAKIFVTQGKILDEVAKKTVKVMIKLHFNFIHPREIHIS